MIVKLERPWKNHPAGTVLDVSDGVHGALVRLGCLSKPESKVVADEVQPPRVNSFRNPRRHKMIESPVEEKHTEEGGE